MHAELAAVPDSLYYVARANRVIAVVRHQSSGPTLFPSLEIHLMSHFIAYNKVEDWGEYVVGGTSFRHFSRHPKPRLEKTLRETVWVISGERVSSRQKYTLCSVFTPSAITVVDDGFTVSGDGFGFNPHIDVTRFAWLSDLVKEQNYFSFGLNQIKSQSIIDGLNAIKNAVEHPAEHFPDEVTSSGKFREGSVRQVTVNAYERNEKARAACIAHYGARCIVCGFDFQTQYGDIGIGVIHVHHLKMLSEVSVEHTVDPINDLRPVCPNCHTAIHLENPPRSIEQVKESLAWDFWQQ